MHITGSGFVSITAL